MPSGVAATPNMKGAGLRLVFDIESDGLMDTMTVIHSLCMIDVDTGQRYSCHDRAEWKHPDPDVIEMSIDDGLRLLMEVEDEGAIGHNVINFDCPAITLVKPWFKLRREQVSDTLIDARLIYPEIKQEDFGLRRRRQKKLQLDEDQLKAYWPGRLIGSQGLEAWGVRLGEWKGDYKAERESKLKALHEENDWPKPTKDQLTKYVWGTWNEEMQLYCDQDVAVNIKLWRVLQKKGYSHRARIIERDFAWILAEMERNGFPFHQKRAAKLQHKLMKRKAEIDAELAKSFEPIVKTWDFTPKANNSKLGYEKGKTIKKTETIFFNPGSRDHIAMWLKKKYGWKPVAYTEKGKPQIDDKVLKKLPFPEASLLAEGFLIDKRLGMLEGKGGKGLIPFGKTGLIHGRVITNGAVTRRCTHMSPNMAQLPASSVPYGHEFRSLMYAPEGWSLLGWDASGLELRCFAHYMARYDGGKYRDTVLSGDIHWLHVIALGLVPEGTERYDGFDEKGDPIEIPEHERLRGKIAKRFIYAYLYGAGAEMIGDIVNPKGSAAAKKKAGKELIESFLARTPALKLLKEAIAAFMAAKGNYITGIDGGRISVRSEHSALNSLLQSSGAIAVKVATIKFYDKLVEAGLVSGVDFKLVAHVHDEVQCLVKKGKEDIVGKIAQDAMREAGEALGFQCPLAAEYKYGENWAETH